MTTLNFRCDGKQGEDTPDILCDVVTICDDDYYKLQTKLDDFISTGIYSECCKYGDSFEVIDIEYQNYYRSVLDNDKTLIWEATVIFKYQEGDLELGNF